MSNSNDRKVVLQGTAEGAAVPMLHVAGQEAFANVNRAVLSFEEVQLSTFTAKFVVKDNNLVFQFYLLPNTVTENTHPKTVQRWMDWWLRTFPSKLNDVAQAFFEAGPPRLQAKYTEELTSWWFRAQGFGDSLDPQAFAQRFLQKLDAAVQAPG